MKRKVVFILKTIEQQRCIKRINAFIDAGVEVEVFGFQRIRNIKLDLKFQVNCLGSIDEGASYIKRNRAYMKALPIIRKYNSDDNVLFYLFGLDLALPLVMFGKVKNYVYEESDLIHTKFKSRAMVRLFERIDKWIIRKSKVSVMTSEGFLIYHYGQSERPANVCVLPNKLNRRCLTLPNKQRTLDFNHLTVGFVGFYRYDSVYNFLKVTAEFFPQIEVRLFGANNGWSPEMLKVLCNMANVKDMGSFKNPDELARVYSQIDIVVSTYDIIDDNPRYAEPNKVYEAIFYETPIIVTTNTYLANKVETLGIGYHLNAMLDTGIRKFWEKLTEEDLRMKIQACRTIDRSYCIDTEEPLFNKLKEFGKLAIDIEQYRRRGHCMGG